MQRAYASGQVHLQARVKVRVKETVASYDEETKVGTRIVDTTVGRALAVGDRARGSVLRHDQQANGQESDFKSH